MFIFYYIYIYQLKKTQIFLLFLKHLSIISHFTVYITYRVFYFSVLILLMQSNELILKVSLIKFLLIFILIFNQM